MLYLFDYSVDDVGKVENVPDDLIFPIFGYLESHSNFSFVLLFTYLFTLLHNKGTFTESRLSISAANRWFRSDARAGVAITS